MAFKLQSVVNEEFKIMGLSLRSDAAAAVVAFLDRSAGLVTLSTALLCSQNTMTGWMVRSV